MSAPYNPRPLTRMFRTAALVLLGALVSQFATEHPSAQLAIPQPSASPGGTISSTAWTQNFTHINANALSRTAGVVLGDLSFSPDNSIDIGEAGANRPRDLFLGRNLDVAGNAAVDGTLGVTGASTLAALSATTGTFSSTLGVTGAATLSGGATVTGTVTAATFSGSGASLTSIPETAITDGSLLARVAANETISGLWAFSNPVTNFAGDVVFTNGRGIYADNTTGVNIPLAFITASNQVIYGSPSIAETTTTFLNAGNEISFGVNGVTRATINSSGTLTHAGAVALTGVISPALLAAGNINNWAPTGFASAYLVRAQGNGLGITKITGIAGGAAGRKFTLCNVSSNPFSVVPESGSSTSSNRAAGDAAAEWVFAPGTCSDFAYDGTSSRWRLSSGVQSLPPL